MNVADLQQHLGDLARLLNAAGAAKVAGELDAIRSGLAPFGPQSLKAFADFLVKAEAYSRDAGPHPHAKGGRAAPARRQKAPKASTPNAEVVAAELRDLYDRAGGAAVSVAQLESALDGLKPLGKAALVTVAEAIGLKGMKSKSMGTVLDEIRRRVLGRKGATVRAGLIDRPLPAGGTKDNVEAPAIGTGIPHPVG